MTEHGEWTEGGQSIQRVIEAVHGISIAQFTVEFQMEIKMFNFRTADSIAREQPLDRSALWGVGLCLVLVGIGVLGSGQGGNFIDIPSFLLVLGGTIGAGLVHFPLPDLRAAGRAFREILIEKTYSPLGRIQFFVNLSGAVRRDGFLTLEREARGCRDPFLRKALEISVDGHSSDDIRR
ncbi:MAG: Chemotaxis protein PomA, partial [Pseudomonadota bacterium]